VRNPLRAWFEQYEKGPIVWKWTHYFDVYHKHLCRFRDKQITMLEIGIQSGGSIRMWQHYFGARLQYFGVDINPACKQLETDGVRIFIGDQGDVRWWHNDVVPFLPPLDFVNDDGSHVPKHQIATFETLYGRVKSTGIYMVEDTHGGMAPGSFVTYANRWIAHLYHSRNGGSAASNPSNGTESISFSESIVVFEKRPLPPTLEAVKKGDKHIACSTPAACS